MRRFRVETREGETAGIAFGDPVRPVEVLFLHATGFNAITYQSLLGIELPRSTDVQSSAGIPVAQRELMPGDLVFFRTGRSGRHVGIYLENRKFLHASTEKGVMISGLDDHYWSRRYWKAIRVQP